MHTTITLIAVLMLIDALFTLLNLSKVESMIHSLFPHMEVKKIAFLEGAVAVVILTIKVLTGTLR